MPTGIYKRTKPAWNKGLKGFLIGENSPNWKGGQLKINCECCRKEFNYFPSHRRKYCSQKCTKQHQKELKIFKGKNNGMWKGENAQYGAIHDWIRSRKRPAKQCVVCGRKQTKTGKSVNWANLDGRYKRRKEDYMELCISCHRRWDYGSLTINLFEWQERINYVR